MGCHRRIAIALLVCVHAPAPLACTRPRNDTPNDAPAPATSATPPDRLAPGEAAPGQEKAHDLLLPRGARIERNFGRSIVAFVPMSTELVANFVRQQADEPEAVVGPTMTLFPKLRVRGTTGSHWLRVEIVRADRNDMSNVTVDRIDEKPPIPAGKTNAELLKEVGLTPDGRPLDPQHLE